MPIYVNSGGSKKVKNIYVNNGGTKKVKKAWVNVGGIAKSCYSAETVLFFNNISTPPYWAVKNTNVDGFEQIAKFTVVNNSNTKNLELTNYGIYNTESDRYGYSEGGVIWDINTLSNANTINVEMAFSKGVSYYQGCVTIGLATTIASTGGISFVEGKYITLFLNQVHQDFRVYTVSISGVDIINKRVGVETVGNATNGLPTEVLIKRAWIE